VHGEFRKPNSSLLPFKNTLLWCSRSLSVPKKALERDDQRIAINHTEFGAVKTTELHPSEVMPQRHRATDLPILILGTAALPAKSAHAEGARPQKTRSRQR
jgi:hypothetical protein